MENTFPSITSSTPFERLAELRKKGVFPCNHFTEHELYEVLFVAALDLPHSCEDDEMVERIIHDLKLRIIREL